MTVALIAVLWLLFLETAISKTSFAEFMVIFGKPLVLSKGLQEAQEPEVVLSTAKVVVDEAAVLKIKLPDPPAPFPFDASKVKLAPAAPDPEAAAPLIVVAVGVAPSPAPTTIVPFGVIPSLWALFVVKVRFWKVDGLWARFLVMSA